MERILSIRESYFYTQQSEQTLRSPENEHYILAIITCTICGTGYALASAHQSLLQAPPTVLEAAFMSMCHFCFRCRRPACPECWDAVHGVCGACVQEAYLPFRVEARPLNGVIFPPVRGVHTTQENMALPPLVCIRPGRFQTAGSPSTDPLKTLPVAAALTQDQLPEETEKQDRTTGRIPTTTPTSQVQDGDMYEPQRTNIAIDFFRVVEPIVTVILLIVLLAIAVIIVLAEISGTANAQIISLFHVDVRYEIGYLISLIRQLHF